MSRCEYLSAIRAKYLQTIFLEVNNMIAKRFSAVICLVLAAVLSLSCAAVSWAEGTSPVAQNLELETCRDVSTGGTLTASDPDGGTLSFQITTQPVKGTIRLESDGKFVYTPASGKKGRDYFGFKATDEQGNVSQEGTVVIKIGRQKAAVTYSDMSGRGEYYDAVLLAKNGIFTGEKVGASYLFSPDRAVTRGEFVTMCVEISGSDVLSGVMSTGFADDQQIPAWEKPYVSTAVMSGMVCGYSTEDGAVFNPQAPVTLAEASVMLGSASGLTEVSCEESGAAVPAWAAQSAAALTSKGIISGGAPMSSTLTRAQAAEMLVKALNAIKSK
jgi:hypothetical protein